jgi:predicted amidohydrolase
MPGAATQPLFDRAARHRMAMSFGFAELTPDGRHFNTSVIVDKEGRIVGKYRKVHLPGHDEFDPDRTHQHLEKRYFEPGDLGFPVWRTLGGLVGMCICNDRRWPETYRVMGLQGVELVVLGFNTPSVNSQNGSEGLEKRMFHHKLSLQAGAYQNSTWVVAVAKAGVEDGHHLMGGTCIVNPDGEIVAELEGEADGVLVHDCDLDATASARRRSSTSRATGASSITARSPRRSACACRRNDARAMPFTTAFADLDLRERYKLLCATVVPRPIALVTTLARNGVVNAARSASSTSSRRIRPSSSSVWSTSRGRCSRIRRGTSRSPALSS